jgi:hypothetical protein
MPTWRPPSEGKESTRGPIHKPYGGREPENSRNFRINGSGAAAVLDRYFPSFRNGHATRTRVGGEDEISVIPEDLGLELVDETDISEIIAFLDTKAAYGR